MNWPLQIIIVMWLVMINQSSCAAVSSAAVDAARWKVWKLDQGKSYESAKEEALRYSIWLDNMEYIEQHNQNAEQHGFSLRMNSFGDLTLEEWTTFYKCHRPEAIEVHMSSSQSSLNVSQLHKSSISLPSAFDWREKHKVTKVKNQNEYRCHSCYAFASTAALESAHAIQTGKLFSLSAQQLIDCSRTYYNIGCQGGNYRNSWTYVMENGIASLTTYPYKSVEGSCVYDQSKEAVSMTYYRLIEEGEDEILNTVAEQGPVVVSIDHQTRTFMFYSSGVYSNHLCSTHYSGLTHEMVVVGYGPASNSTTPYWILKNSYGSRWGMDGYMHMVRNKNMCGIAMDAAYPIL